LLAGRKGMPRASSPQRGENSRAEKIGRRDVERGQKGN